MKSLEELEHNLIDKKIISHRFHGQLVSVILPYPPSPQVYLSWKLSA